MRHKLLRENMMGRQSLPAGLTSSRYLNLTDYVAVLVDTPYTPVKGRRITPPTAQNFRIGKVTGIMEHVLQVCW